MKTQIKCENKKAAALNAITAILLLLATSTVSAQQSLRKPADPSNAFAKRSGFVTQLNAVYEQALPPNEQALVGNATIISPCRIITNYHVAFGKSKNVDTKKIVLTKNRAKGHEVNFAFDLDAKSGDFRRNVKAKVIGFANYINSTRGMLGDMAVLELETCLDQKEYEQLDLSMATSAKDYPVGTLMTVSAQQDERGRNQILVQQGCKSIEGTPVDGLFIADCETVPGMSGSAVYEMGSDKKWHWTGLSTQASVDPRGITVMIAINAKTIAGFFTQTFGEVPLTIPSLAERKPQSADEQMAFNSARTVVR